MLSPLANPPAGTPPISMTAAEVVSMSYGLRDGLGAVQDKWFDSFLKVLEAWVSKASYTALAYIASNSVGDEIGRSVTNDLYLIVISVAIFVTVAVTALSRWDRRGGSQDGRGSQDGIFRSRVAGAAGRRDTAVPCY